MKHTKKFIELSKDDASIAGGKGSSLGEMLNNNIPVPDGYVVTADTFDEFLAETDLTQEVDAIINKVDHNVIHTIENASEKIQALIKHAKTPEKIKKEILIQFKELDSKYVAVRSSATAEDGADHAWAGQLDSYLNTTEENLLEMVQSCWASLFTPRAIFYRFEKSLHTTHISVAVVIQKMVNSEKSGIAFSVHPVTEDHNQVIIEAGLGLGEAIVSGSVTPDAYVITKEPQEIIDINVNKQNKALYRGKEKTEHGFNEWKDLSEKEAKQQVLSKEQIIELSNIIENIEQHYGFPCDIEWAYEENTFYIVQSRPITTLKKKNLIERINFEKEYTRDTTLIMQQGWNACVINPVSDLENNPFVPPVIHYMNDGVVEIWENKKASKWILDSFQELIKKDEQKLSSLIDKYEEDLEKIKKYWKKGPISDSVVFEKYIEEVYETMKGFDCMYFPSIDDRTPEHIRKRTLKIRDEDVYFDTNDKLIRDSLILMYPKLKGYEAAILKSEIHNPPSVDILKKRKKSFIVIGESFNKQVSFRDYLNNNPEYNFHIEVPPADSSTLIGQVGNKGYVKGIIRIVKRKEQIDGVTKGDIIVSTMTTPDFVPAMKKASAIITDEGGVTCHAAIIARELDKPCVIGTKFATQILKDGDLVEVDADNGIVRILEKNEIVKKEDWRHLGKWDGATLGAEVWFSYAEVAQTFIEKKLNGGLIYLNGDFFLDNEDSNTYINETYEHAKSQELDYFVDLKNTIIKKADELIEYSKSETDVVSFLKKLQEFLGYWMPLNNMAIGLEKYVDEVAQESFALATGSTCEKSWTLQQVDEMREIKSQIQGKTSYRELSADEKQVFDAHIEKYQWKGSHLFSVHNFIAEELFLQLKEDEEVKKDAVLENPSIEIQMLDILAFVRFRCAEAASKAVFIMHSVFNKLSQDNKLTYEELLEHTIAEIDAKDFNKERAQNRIVNKGFIYDGGVTILNDKEIEEYKEILLVKVDVSETTEIKGLTAQKGKAQGIVKVINNKNDVAGFEEGMVLVSYETTPDFVHIMKKSSAIVTNFGGLTSHAAIVAREFNVPCIVGTQNATDILKDGDLVEVDADNGVVKILKKGITQKNKEKDYLYFDLPMYTITNYFHSGLSASLRYKGEYICGLWKLMYSVEGNSKAIVDRNSLVPYGNRFIKRIEENDNEFTDFLYEKYIAVVVLADRLQDLNRQRSLNKKSIKKSDYYDEYNRLFPWVIGIGYAIDTALEDYVQEHNIDLSILNIPGQSFLYKEEASLQQVALGNKDFNEHKAEYSFIFSNYKGYQEVPDEHFTNRLEDVKDKLFKKESKIIKPKTIEEWIAFFVYIRDERKRCNMLFNLLYLEYIKEECMELNLEYSDAVLLMPQEFEEQKIAGVLQVFNGTRYVESTHERGFVDIAKIKWESLVSKLSHGNSVTGIVASSGVVIGRVSIVLNKDDFKKVEEGDVIVASMTRPDFVPILRKTSAIVTNEGGVTCHAAIISRELNIPCIIGTQNATQVLKDGDLVEVDADNGMVKILSR